MASGDEKFRVEGVTSKMKVIESYFSDFATTLSDLNSFIETNVNASLESSVYGILGGQLLSIWDYNASTFQDFHDNFDNWSQVVAIIAANNSDFAVDAQAAYRDNAGTLDGVQEARDYVSKANGVTNAYATYGNLSEDAKAIIDSSLEQGSSIPEPYNLFGGKTVTLEDGTIEYYDKDGKLISKKLPDGTYVDSEGAEIGDSTAYRKWLVENGYVKSIDKTINENNIFGGKTIQKENGTIEYYDKDGNMISYYKDGKYYDKDGKVIGENGTPQEYREWLKANGYNDPEKPIAGEEGSEEGKPEDAKPEDGQAPKEPEATDNNEFGGETSQNSEGVWEIKDRNGEVVATYKDNKYFDREGNEIPDYNKFVEETKKRMEESARGGGASHSFGDEETPDGEGKNADDPNSDTEAEEGYKSDGGVPAPEVTEKNEFGGKTEESDGVYRIYDETGKEIARWENGKYYDRYGKRIDDFDKWSEEHATEPKTTDTADPEVEGGEGTGNPEEEGYKSEGGVPAPEVTEKNEFGGKTEESDGIYKIYDKDGKEIARWENGKYYDRYGKRIDDFDKWSEEHAAEPETTDQTTQDTDTADPEAEGGEGTGNPEEEGYKSDGGVPAPEVTEKNEFGGKTEESDGIYKIYDKDGKEVARWENGKYYDRYGKKIDDFDKWTEDNKTDQLSDLPETSSDGGSSGSDETTTNVETPVTEETVDVDTSKYSSSGGEDGSHYTSYEDYQTYLKNNNPDFSDSDIKNKAFTDVYTYKHPDAGPDDKYVVIQPKVDTENNTVTITCYKNAYGLKEQTVPITSYSDAWNKNPNDVCVWIHNKTYIVTRVEGEDVYLQEVKTPILWDHINQSVGEEFKYGE